MEFYRYIVLRIVLIIRSVYIVNGLKELEVLKLRVFGDLLKVFVLKLSFLASPTKMVI